MEDQIDDSAEKFPQIFAGKTFVLTGTVQKFTSNEASKIIESMGGKTTSSVSKKTSFVVVGENPGSKYNKAKKLGVQILTDREFLEMIS